MKLKLRLVDELRSSSPFADARAVDELRSSSPFAEARVRKFTFSDLKRILEIEKSSFTTDAYPKSRFAKLAKKHSDGFFVIENAGKILGYIIGYKTKKNQGDLDSIAIDPKYRKLGIGKLLLRYILNQFKKKGLRHASLEVRAKNKTAISFYRDMGFKAKRVIKEFYRDKADAYQMERAI